MTNYLQRTGATFRNLMNDLKRDEETAAKELGVAVSLIQEILAGVRAPPVELIAKASRVWPVNERDFFPLHSDAPVGVVVTREEESAATARILQRGGKSYYEYRDTAMSRIAMMRPEWIRILHHVSDCDECNSSVEWNNGHFLYQFTYFIGEVNYYYEFQGRKYCIATTSGDSIFGLPYSRHTFATRSPAAPGLILALTFGGRLIGDPQHELGVLGTERAKKFVISSRAQGEAQAALLALHAQNGSYSVTYLAEKSGLSSSQIRRFLTGEDSVNNEALYVLAHAMRISPRELMPLTSDTMDGIVLVRGDQPSKRLVPDDNNPAYSLKDLAGSSVTPCTKALELSALRSTDEEPFFLETGLHEYGYHLGSNCLRIDWINDDSPHNAVLGPGDSFYIQPFVPHSFRLTDGAKGSGARLLLLRVGGKISGDTLLEASILGTDAMHRVADENKCWYDAAGSR
jgi:transcriptional regulator with XRE-family HTH domain